MEFNSGFKVLKKVCLPAKKFNCFKTHKSECTPDAIHFTSMATSHNRFSVIEELGSHAFFFARLQHQYRLDGGYPELPDLSDNPLP